MTGKDFCCAKCTFTFTMRFEPSLRGRILKCPKCQSRNVTWSKPATKPTQKRRRPCCG